LNVVLVGPGILGTFYMDTFNRFSRRQLHRGYVLKIFLASVYLLLSGCSVSVLTSVASSPDGSRIVAVESSDDRTSRIYLYDPSTLTELTLLKAEKEKILSGETGAFRDERPLAISFDGRFLAAAGRRHSVDVWELSSERHVMHLPQLAGAISIAFSPKANILAVAGPTSETTVWSVPDGKLLAVLRGKPTSPNTAVAISPHGKMVAVGDADRTVRLWALPDGRELGVLEGHGGWVHSLSFSPDAKTLTVYAGKLKFWLLPEMQPLPLFPELGDLGATSIPGHLGMFSPDGKFFAYYRFYVTYLLGLEDYAREVVVFSFGSKKIIRIDCKCRSFTFSPDSSKLVTVGAPILGTSPIKIWNPVTGERIR
jgi:WD40 repeat protein